MRSSAPHRFAPRLLVVGHEEDSGAELLGDAAIARGFVLDVRTPVSGELPHDVQRYDAVLVLGSACSVNDDAIQPWLASELDLLRDADARGVPVFGVCFGAQALAVALGGSVHEAVRPEIGWVEVHTVDPDRIPAGPWFQWHTDAITPPPGATILATTAVCVQAYTVGPHLAVQFHPEAQLRQTIDWPIADPVNMARAGVDAAVIASQTSRALPGAARRAAALFDTFLDHAGVSKAVSRG